MLELPEGFLRDVARRLDAADAVALSMTSRKLREASGNIAVAKAVIASQDAPAAVRASLDKAATLQDEDAIDRGEILRNAAVRIGQSPAAVVGMVRRFLHTVAPLQPQYRADVLAALKASLPLQSNAMAVLDNALALETLDARPGVRGAALAAQAESVSSTRDPEARLAIFDAVADKVGELPAGHRAEALMAVTSKLAALTDDAAQAQALKLLAQSRELPADGLGQAPLVLVRKMGAPSEPSAAFDRAWHDAMRLAEGAALPLRQQMGALLADKIRSLAPEARHAAFDRTIALVSTLPPQPRDEALEHLAKAIEFLPEAAPESTSERRPGRADALHKVLASLAGMRDRDLTVVAAAAAVQHVTHRRAEMFDPVFAAVMSLPMAGQRKAGLQALVGAAASHDRAPAELGRILGSLASFGEAERAELVLTAVRALERVQHLGSLPALMLEHVATLPRGPRSLALKEFFSRPRWQAVSPEELARTVDAALPLISRLPAHDAGRAAGDAAAFLPIAQMEAAARTSTFTRLLQQAERSPDSTLLEALSRTMRNANDPALTQLGFEPLLTLVGKREPIVPQALSYLAGQLCTLPQPQLEAALPQVRSLAERIPPTYDVALDAVVSGVAQALPLVNPQMQAQALAWVQLSATKLCSVTGRSGARSKALSTLASVIPSLPQAMRQGVFNAVLSHVGQVLEADRRAQPHMLRQNDGRQLHPDQRAAGLLAQLAGAAGSLAGLAPRAAVAQILTALQGIADPASRAEVLKSLPF